MTTMGVFLRRLRAVLFLPSSLKGGMNNGRGTTNTQGRAIDMGVKKVKTNKVLLEIVPFGQSALYLSFS